MKRQSEPSSERTCFVISPIGEDNSDVRRRSDQVFRFIITPAAEDNNLQAIRSDLISTPGMITQQIIQHILNDRMVVADITDQNANVFYELALRHAFGKPVVQIILANQKIPFDVYGARTVHYDLDLEHADDARHSISKQIAASLAPGHEIQSPVKGAARLEDLLRSSPPESQVLMKTILDQIDTLNKAVSDMVRFIPRKDDLKEALPPAIIDQIGEIIRRYAEEIELLKSVRDAGITGIFKRREKAIQSLARAIDEESKEIMVIGSSLKGLLQKEEYKNIAEKLRFKTDRGLVHIKFLLTHPIVADFRARQENRGFTEIGHEIINTLEMLKHWSAEYCHVKLYLGTPTCFAIKTTRNMLINPYPYISVSYDSPSLILENSSDGGALRPGYFFDEFNSRHFGAWDSDLAVRITTQMTPEARVQDYDKVIAHCRNSLKEYAASVENLLDRGKQIC